MRRIVAAVAVLAALTGCGSGNKVDGGVTVFAATSLTGAFTDIGKAFKARHPGTKVTFNFAASSALVSQLDSGAPADVVAFADTKSMRSFGAGATVFAHNRLVIATQPANPSHVQRLGDLTHAGVVSLCAVEVPCGAYAAQALTNAGVTIAESNVTRGANAAATLAAVVDGDAVAAIVYTTDAKAAGRRVQTVAIPAEDNVVADYPIVRLRRARNIRGANAFVDFVLGDGGQRILKRYGFLTT